MRRLIIGFYLATTPQDWQFGPGFYIGDHLELSLYLGPWSFNLEIELERPVKNLILSDIHFDDFRGLADFHPRCRSKYDPFTHKVIVQGDEIDTYRTPRRPPRREWSRCTDKYRSRR